MGCGESKGKDESNDRGAQQPEEKSEQPSSNDRSAQQPEEKSGQPSNASLVTCYGFDGADDVSALERTYNGYVLEPQLDDVDVDVLFEDPMDTFAASFASMNHDEAMRATVINARQSLLIDENGNECVDEEETEVLRQLQHDMEEDEVEFYDCVDYDDQLDSDVGPAVEGRRRTMAYTDEVAPFPKTLNMQFEHQSSTVYIETVESPQEGHMSDSSRQTSFVKRPQLGSPDRPSTFTMTRSTLNRSMVNNRSTLNPSITKYRNTFQEVALMNTTFYMGASFSRSIKQQGALATVPQLRYYAPNASVMLVTDDEQERRTAIITIRDQLYERLKDTFLQRKDRIGEMVHAPVANLLADVSAQSMSLNCDMIVEYATWNFLSLPEAVGHLNKGGGYFRFLCKPCSSVTEVEQGFLRAIVNLTSFKNETKENNVPHLAFDVGPKFDDVMGKFTAIMVKTTYLIRGKFPEDVSPELLSSVKYQKGSQPGKPKVWDDCTDHNTFRVTKPIIPFIYSIVIQFKVSEIKDKKAKQALSVIDGVVPDKVLLLERTKRDKSKSANSDPTVKCKSMLLYYKVQDGMLVTNMTCVLNSSVPKIVSSLLNNFGGKGSAEASETAENTRSFLATH